MTVAIKKKRRSQRGNWLVVTYVHGRIVFVRWCYSRAGVGMSKRNAELYIPPKKDGSKDGRVFVLDIERMMAFAVTEGADEINDLYRLWEKS